jgi:hypothetical protein
MEPRQIHPDDEVYHFRAVWLGPKGMTWPVTASYAAWWLGFGLFLAIVMSKRILGLEVGTPPLFEAAYAGLITAFIMIAVDYDKPIRAVVVTTARVYATRHLPTAKPSTTTPSLPMLKITRDPLNEQQ